MKFISILIGLGSLPALAFAREAKLDSHARATSDAGSLVLTATPSKFRQMQHRYRPASFAIWKQKLESLKGGMTENQFAAMLRPRRVEIDRVITSSGRMDRIILDDAYFAFVNVSPKTGEVVWATPPIAITYEIVSR
ncbi:MAG: hypothetical protein QOH01_2038 [Verrucomicrobiota bacterium]|jgi:hypothetical protein